MVSKVVFAATVAALVASASCAAIQKRDEYSGKATFFTPGEGNCGGYNSDSDMIVALSTDLYGSTSDVSGDCWKYVDINYQGKSVTAQVVDSCPSCESTSLDLSPAVFGQLASLDLGEIDISWSFSGSSSSSSNNKEAIKATSTSSSAKSTSTHHNHHHHHTK